MSLTLEKILAASPATTRGQPTQLSSDPKGQRIAYASGKSIFLRSIDDPSDSKQYKSHTATTTVARFSPSGFYVASGDVSGTVRVWDAMEAENTKGEYHIISGRINDLAWDGDSQRIIVAGDGRERFGHCITADSGNSVGEISGHGKIINSVAIRPMRPMRAATASDDMSMCFLHGPPFKFNSKASGLHKGFVFATAFSPDGNSLVTVGADKRIQLYDGKTGEPTRNFGESEHTGSILAVSWAQDSKKLVTASADRTVRVWDVEAGKATQTWKFGGDARVSIPDQQVGVVWPHGRTDGLIISLSLGGDLTYLKEGSPEPIKVIQGHNKSITAMGAGSDGSGQSVWTGSFNGRVCRWDVAAGAASAVDGQTHTNQIAQFVADAGRAYSVGWDDTLRIIDESASTYVGEAPKLSAQPKGVAVADGRVFVATISGVEIYVKDSLAGKLDINDSEPTSIAASGSLVAVGTNSNAVRLYKVDSSNKLTLSAETKNSPAQISALAFSPDGNHLVAGNTSGKLFAYKTTDLSLVTDRWSEHTGRIISLAWNEDGDRVASGSLDTHVYVWSLKNPSGRTKALNAHKDGVNAVAWVSGGKKIASTGGDAAVKIWSMATL
ncbi:WD domain-containing protein [Pseudomassariella vexata]|uniref:WD domain-containing protein n=1 Tax=Pseudomassariella vexata TaxID=1141098 RepID=A0A1Y2E077_9PEZI|nr:WD domain-containing protein [Pseudomassariella vexata]ORY64943.1 WD domain-containing protein [Pseudomassariella vexata]